MLENGYAELFARVLLGAARGNPAVAVRLSGHAVPDEELESVASDYLADEAVRARITELRRLFACIEIDMPETRAEVVAWAKASWPEFLDGDGNEFYALPPDRLPARLIPAVWKMEAVETRGGIRHTLTLINRLDAYRILFAWKDIALPGMDPLNPPAPEEIELVMRRWQRDFDRLVPAIH